MDAAGAHNMDADTLSDKETANHGEQSDPRVRPGINLERYGFGAAGLMIMGSPAPFFFVQNNSPVYSILLTFLAQADIG